MLDRSVFSRPFSKIFHAPRAKKYISLVSLHSQDGQHAPIDVCLGKEVIESMLSVQLASSDSSVLEQCMGNFGIFEMLTGSENAGCSSYQPPISINVTLHMCTRGGYKNMKWANSKYFQVTYNMYIRKKQESILSALQFKQTTFICAGQPVCLHHTYVYGTVFVRVQDAHDSKMQVYFDAPKKYIYIYASDYRTNLFQN